MSLLSEESNDEREDKKVQKKLTELNKKLLQNEEDEEEDLLAHMTQDINDVLEKYSAALSLSQQWKHMLSKFAKLERENVKYLYHATSQQNADDISKTGKYLAEKCKEGFGPGGRIKGVWFCPTLHDGKLPTQSPYGGQRIAIRITDIITDKRIMFYERAHYFTGGAQYFRFFLVKEAQKEEFEWCKKNLVKVSLIHFFHLIGILERQSVSRTNLAVVSMWI